MPIRPLFYETKIDGGFRAGIEFDSVADREAWLVDVRAGCAVLPPPPTATMEDLEEVRPIGRPSHGPAIEAAIEALGPALDPNLTLRDRARHVRRHISKARPDRPDEVPALDTIERWIGKRVEPRKNPAGKIAG